MLPALGAQEDIAVHSCVVETIATAENELSESILAPCYKAALYRLDGSSIDIRSQRVPAKK